MRHDPRLLELYAQRLQAERRQRIGWPARASYGPLLQVALAITITMTGVFWLYDAFAHPATPHVPAFVPALESKLVPSRNPYLIAGEAPAPDMKSPLVAMANADVSTKAQAAAAPATQTVGSGATRTETPAKRKHVVRHAKRLPAAAARAYASEPRFSQRPYFSF